MSTATGINGAASTNYTVDFKNLLTDPLESSGDSDRRWHNKIRYQRHFRRATTSLSASRTVIWRIAGSAPKMDGVK
jgi:hypothetical protein